jgi:tetratricopeptide (TPR) repeat protein/2-polyprenyl-3-methyl-5-hydroxy-6-metoxy-1,4-benzoquinol methylase
MNRKERRAAGKQAGNAPLRPGSRPDLADLFGHAVRSHQAGQLAEAERLYRAVLAIDPRHVTSLNYLGILALQSGRYPMAVEVIRQALTLDDRMPESHYNIAFAQYRLGRLEDAAGHYRRAATLKKDYADAHTNLGNVLKEQGKLDDAAACYRRVIELLPQAPEPHYNLANVLAQQDKLDDAIAAHRQALARNPDFVGSHNNLATALAAKGETAAAIEHYQRALALQPNLTEAHINLGVMLAAAGQLDEALTHYRRALEIDPNQPEAHTNLANALMSQGHLEQAAVHCARALALKPDSPEMHNNFGILLAAQGKDEEAGRHFEQALTLKPDFIDPFNNLARVLLGRGLVDPALGVLRRALDASATHETKGLLAQCLRSLPRAPDTPDFRELVLRALSEPWARPQSLAGVAASVIKHDASLKQYIERATAAWPARLSAVELFGPSGLLAAAEHDLLRALLESATIPDIALERFLTGLRFALLDSVSTAATEPNEKIIALACALARQCFLNEYVFATAADELAVAQDMRDSLVGALASNTEIAGLHAAAVAAYFPLASLPGCAGLLERTWPEPLRALLIQQILEPEQQRDLRATIPRITTIDDRVSLLVKEQYEENPYPRWVTVEPAGTPLLVDQYFRTKFPTAGFRTLGKTGEIDLLIAGCGTGQHAIETAQRFKNARVLAIDLSSASLSYAAFQTRELGLTSIEYGQADILQFGSVDRMFDIIEAGGVLHHMADPFAGWRVLLSRLRPNGFMAVGLYSEIARAKLEPARAIIAERGYGTSAVDIRRFRQEVMGNDDPLLKEITESGDFYSISTCRDLLFHVQEHRLTLPQIGSFLQDNNLQFLGFELDPALTGQYRRRFPEDASLTDLSRWHAFEMENPKTFAGMYQFWVQKASD